MKKLSLATALYLSTAALAFADSNSLIVTQASVGAGAPSINFTQSNSGALASVIQNGNDTLTGVQVGTGGTKLNVDQENPTAGAVNTIGYTGRGNSDVTIDQRASNGIFTASGSAGNTATVDMQGNIAGNPANKLFVDQVGFNNNAIVYDTFAGTVAAPLAEGIQVGQYSDKAAAANQLQLQSTGILGGYFLQQNGNKANVTINGGTQNVSLTQTNTADNAALANVANITIAGAGFNFTQTGTTNDLEANLTGSSFNQGLKGFQSGSGNLATFTQKSVYQDSATGPNTIDQTGNNNIATATQNLGTHDSKFGIFQTGNNDNATLVQVGTSNVASMTQQGNLNTASLTQSGTGATATIAQH